MYADNIVLFANNAEGLQKVLDNLEKYCTKWKLKVNCHKTKVTVFGRSRVNKSRLNFIYNQSRLEIVDCFKYLGVNFQFNGIFLRWKKDLSEQWVRALYSIHSKGRALNLSLDIMLDLFDKMICPVLLYASEVWEPGSNAVIERVHLICKYILGLKRSTPNCIVYRELGRYPVDIKIKTSIIAYWSRVVNNQNQNKLTSLLYKTLYQLYTTGVFRSTRMETIETVLNECGMSNIWQTQCQGISTRWLKGAVKARLQAQFVQRTDNPINVNSKCFLYKDIKQDHKFEDYLVNLPRCFYVPILKLRSCNHRLPVERGRYSNIPREWAVLRFV